MKCHTPWVCLIVVGVVSAAPAQVTPLELGVEIDGLVGDGQSAYYRLELVTTAHLVLTLQNHHRASRHHLYIQTDVLPTADDHLAASRENRPEQVIDLSALAPGAYYIRVHGSSTFCFLAISCG
jgi:hypothetical protein